ncbi:MULTISPECIES: EAL domain-containing protein [Cyanophyceae]|uniref:EAL domain-containing protein n=1 Tax=Leptolyngbya subtilissima DQ-A4 TaxID=2933933 RepID=A0ABV0K8W7_9CYAN|nr:EAL domain-containing protein [Nodosilinea sp. FACHB-141]MBD2110651.1 EAL domain-containing protein [Nodosilinea sp. FACHB-141]
MQRFFPSWVNTSLGIRLGVAFSGITLLLSAVLGGVAGRQAEDQIERDMGYRLELMAGQLTEELDRSLFERYREIQIIAEFKLVGTFSQAMVERQSLLERLQSTYPDYTWIGFADTQGVVQVSTQDLLEGVSVAERDWFIAAKNEPFVGDVHDAKLLSKLLPPKADGAPLRLLDVAAPVYSDRGELQGVLGAHITWEWVEEVATSLMQDPAASNQAVFIVDAAGKVILGPEAWQGQQLNLNSLRLAQTESKGFTVERWPDGEHYLVGFFSSQGHSSYPGLGWTILVHEPVSTAFSPARALFWKILLGGLSLGSGFVVVGWLAAYRITKPLLQIAAAADQIRDGNRDVLLPRIKGRNEVSRLTEAFTQLIANLFAQETALRTSNSQLRQQLQAKRLMGRSLKRGHEQLRQIVDGIEDSLLLREVSTGKLIYSNNRFADLYQDVVADNSSPGAWLQYVHPDDRPWVSEKFADELQGKDFFNDEYRFIGADGHTRWIWNRSFPIRDEQGEVYRYVVIERDITEIKQATDALQQLMAGTAAVTGEAFFQQLVRHLASALDADCVYVAERQTDGMHTLAFWCEGELQPNITIAATEMPCALVLNQGFHRCVDQVAESFSTNPFLQRLKLKGYVGVTMTSAGGDVLGLLCVMSKRPLRDRIDYATILQIFANRAAAELERQQAEAALQQSEARFRLLAENVKDLVCLHDLSGKFLYLSPSCTALLGFEPEELVGSDPYRQCHPEDRPLMQPQFQQALHDPSAGPITYRVRCKNRRYIWLETLIKVICSDEGVPTYLQTSSRDVTDQVRMLEQMEHDATHDSLTGLPNRSLLLERLNLAIKRIHQHDDAQFAVLLIDLDRFKVINDSLGHQVGDRLLQLIAKRLQAAIGGVDLAARLGGDEFVLLIEDIDNLAAAVRTAERVLGSFQTAIPLASQDVVIGASIGIVLGDRSYSEGINILRDAEIAMYSAKQTGQLGYTIFNQTMHQKALQRLELENALRLAIAQQELTLRYQPIVDLATGSLVGFEALVRWQHPVQGMISPVDFIPIAEDTGLIVPLGTWVLKTACQQLATWQAQFPASAALKMSVNLSVVQLKESNLVALVEQVLAETGLPGHCLALEITESMFMEDIEVINQRLQQLNQRDIQISIDDFGTGFSSLSYLHRLSVNNLKIDRSFVNNLSESHRNLSMARTIINLSQQLGLTTIAEGIETPEQLQQLKSLGCQLGQGYLFNAPVTSAVAETLVAELTEVQAAQAQG